MTSKRKIVSEGAPKGSTPKETKKKKQKTVKNVSQSSSAPTQPSEHITGQDLEFTSDLGLSSSYSIEDSASKSSEDQRYGVDVDNLFSLVSKSTEKPKKTKKKAPKKQTDITVVESESSSLRRSERIARQESDLASDIRNLELSSTIYGVDDLPSSAFKFKKRDMKALKLNFLGASTEKDVIPDVEVTIPEKYIFPGINLENLQSMSFDVEKVNGLTDVKVQTFFTKLHMVVMNSSLAIGTAETCTDALVDNLLRIAGLDDWPLMIRNYPLCKVYIEDEPRVSSDPEFVVALRKNAILVVEDKHLKNVGSGTAFGESQMAVEILACGSENNYSLGKDPIDQVLWAVRVISTYVTFYQTTIPAKYWIDLESGLPKVEVKVQRWPAEYGAATGFDLATPDGRRSVLTGLAKIREFLRQGSTSTAMALQGTKGSKKGKQKVSEN